MSSREVVLGVIEAIGGNREFWVNAPSLDAVLQKADAVVESAALDAAAKAIVCDLRKELDARGEILDRITAACPGFGNSWLKVEDWRKSLRDYAEDDESHEGVDEDRWRDLREEKGGPEYIILVPHGGFFAAYYGDADILLEMSDDDLPVFHVSAHTSFPSRAVIHPLHLAAWLEHLATHIIPVKIACME